MKTSRTRAAGQQTDAKARTRSTSALATETRATRLRRHPAAICRAPGREGAEQIEVPLPSTAAQAIATRA